MLLCFFLTSTEKISFTLEILEVALPWKKNLFFGIWISIQYIWIQREFFFLTYFFGFADKKLFFRYLTSKSDHAPQSLSIQIGIETIKKYKSQHIGEKILIICGSYLIGKEKMWVKIAETFNIKVWAEPRRRQALKCLNNIEINQRLVDNQQDADLHILSMGKNLMYENIVKYMDQLQDSFTHAIVIKPSGWEAHSKARNQGNISIVGVEYSEHSSFQELKRFVRFLRPKNVISTVPIGRGVVNTPCVPEKWYLGETKPKTKRGQQSITNFIAVTPVVPVIPVVPDIPVAEEELLMDLTLFSDDKSDWMS